MDAKGGSNAVTRAAGACAGTRQPGGTPGGGGGGGHPRLVQRSERERGQRPNFLEQTPFEERPVDALGRGCRGRLLHVPPQRREAHPGGVVSRRPSGPCMERHAEGAERHGRGGDQRRIRAAPRHDRARVRRAQAQNRKGARVRVRCCAGPGVVAVAAVADLLTGHEQRTGLRSPPADTLGQPALDRDRLDSRLQQLLGRRAETGGGLGRRSRLLPNGWPAALERGLGRCRAA